MTTPHLPARYDLCRPLGAGGMGEVWLVHDRERGQDVALKASRPAPGADAGEAGYLFRQEFWAMVALAHPHLVAALDFGELPDGVPYFTMEYVAGADLGAAGRQGEAAVRRWLPGLARALAHLHARGYVHADLKPENVRVGADGQVKLMDLGLLTRAGQAGGPIRGTPAYLAPEAIRQGALDARTDLYALGAMLHEALAGRRPFEAASTIALLRAHLSAAPSPLPADADASPALARAVMRLLAKDPADRFASAGDLLAALGLDAGDVAGATLLGSPIVGREPAQGALAGLLADDGPAALVLAGGPGAGKSRLLVEAGAEAQLLGRRTFVARGIEPEGAPYGAVGPWLRALAAEPSPTRDRLAPVLVRVMPELPAAPAPALDGAAERLRLHDAVAELAREAAPRALWVLDDADRADAASRELAAHLRAAGLPGWRWLEARHEPGEGALALPPLAPDHVLTIADAMLGHPAPPEVAERLPELAAGQPGAAVTILAHWVRTGALVRADGRWAAAPEAAFDLPGGLAVALDEGFEALPADARLVGRLAGLVGDLPPAGLLALAGLPDAAFFAGLGALEEAGVVRRDGQGLAFARAAQAAALAATWPPAEAARLHGAAAAWLARDAARGPEDAATPLARLLAIARHGLRGDAPGEAVPWAIAAARRALALGAVAAADDVLRRAAEAPADPAGKLALARIEGAVRRLQGRGEDAVALYEAAIVPALRAAGDPGLAHELTGLGVALQMQGEYARARDAFREAYDLADARGDAAEGARARLQAGRVAYFAGEPEAARALLGEAVAGARRAGAPALLAGALAFHGYVLASTDPACSAEGLAALEEAVALNRELRDVVETHEALNLRGNLLMAEGRHAEAEAAFEDCRALAERTGMVSELTFAHLNLGAVAIERGAAEAALAHAEAALALARRQGRRFPEGFSIALEGLARVRLGAVEPGLAAIAEGLALAQSIQNRYLELHVRAYQVEGLVAAGRAAEAAAALAEARELATASGNAEHDARFERLAAAIEGLHAAPPTAGPADPRVQAVLDLAAAAGATSDLAAAMDLALRTLMALAGGERGHLLLYEDATVTEQAFFGEAGGDDFSASVAFKVYWSEEPLWIEDVAGDEALAASRSVQALGLRSVLGVPLIVEDADGAGPLTVGVMLAESRRVREAPTEADFALLRELGRQAAAIVWRAKRLAALREADATRALVERLAAGLLAAAEPGAAFRLAAAEAIVAVGAERALLLWGPDLAPREGVDAGGATLPAAARQASRTVAGWVLDRGEPMRIVDAQADDALADARSVMALGLKTISAAPVAHGGTTFGVLYLDDQRLGEPDPLALGRVARVAALLGAWFARGEAR